MPLQVLITGLVFGCIYALAALGLVFIYRTTSIVNFAHGEMAMVCAFICYYFIKSLGLPYSVAFIVTLIIASLFGALIYWLFMRFLLSATHLNQLVVTLGLFLAFHGLAGIIWGHTPESFPEALSGDPVALGRVYIDPNSLFIVGVTVALAVLLFCALRFTRIGFGMRAASQDLTAATLMGINVGVVFVLVWAVGASLGAVASILTAPSTYLSVSMMFTVLILAFAAAILGGFTSMPGAVIGGLIIGVANNIISYYLSPKMSLVATFGLIVLFLYARPQGLLGETQSIKKV